MVCIAGVGRHLQAVLMYHPQQLMIWAKCIYALDLLYFAAVTFPKLSILCLYLRIFAVNAVVQRISQIMTGLVILIWLSLSLASTFECLPFSYRWNKTIVGGRCFNIVLFYRLVNVSNLVTDVAILSCRYRLSGNFMPRNLEERG